jgi:hypothetical protein
MSFDKTYPNRKDQRKPYRGSKRFDRGCRNHGKCSRCEEDRLIQARREEPPDEREQIREALQELEGE